MANPQSPGVVAREFTIPPPIGAAIQAVTGLSVLGAAGSVAPETPPLEQLEDAGLLDGGSLRSDLRAALELHAARTRAISVAVTVPERQSWERLVAYGIADTAAGYAAISTVTGSTVVSTYPAVRDLAEVVRPHLFLASRPTPTEPGYALTVESWTALVAIADVLQRRQLERTLAREPRPISPRFQPDELAEAVGAGATAPDLRWMCSLGAALCPLPLPETPEAAEGGLVALEAEGLVSPSGDGWQLTVAGEALAFLFRSLITAAVFGGTRIRPDAPNEWAMIGALASPVGCWLIRWNNVTATTASGRIGPATPEDLHSAFEELEAFSLRAPESQPESPKQAMPAVPPCTNCRASLAPGARFCSTCGAAVRLEVYCSKCGRKLAENAKFCPGCGTPVGPA